MPRRQSLPRIDYWRCPCYSTAFCASCECGTLPRCSTDPCWAGLTNCVVRQEGGTREMCDEPNCPCWTGNGCPPAEVSQRLHSLWLVRAQRYLRWVVRRLSPNSPDIFSAQDLNIWLELYETLQRQGVITREADLMLDRIRHILRTRQQEEESEAEEDTEEPTEWESNDVLPDGLVESPTITIEGPGNVGPPPTGPAYGVPASKES